MTQNRQTGDGGARHRDALRGTRGFDDPEMRKLVIHALIALVCAFTLLPITFG